MARFSMTYQDREYIMCRLVADPDVTWTVLGDALGCHRSSVEREVNRNGGKNAYSAGEADRRAVEQATRSQFLFDTDPELAGEVTELLLDGYSPYAVAHELGTVSTETIYQGVYSGRLGVDPTKVLRTRRPRRRHRHLRQPTSEGNYLGDFTPIAERPVVINERIEFGHWEGDLITGTANKSAVITLTERVTRYQVALDLPCGHSADRTMDRLCQWVNANTGIMRSLTWDRGAELTRWKRLTHHGISVFFCDPKSPWQRGSNENANRQLRFWFPRRTDLSIYAQDDLDRACHTLNTTPRRIHNNHTAQQLYDHHTRNDH